MNDSRTSNYHCIGTSHIYCQDYSLSGNYNEIAYAIVSDGCSTSHNLCGEVDIGASLLAKFASNFVKKIYHEIIEDSDDKKEALSLLSVDDFLGYLHETVDIANFKETYFFKDGSFDATLVMAISYEDCCKIFVLGDGGFCVERKSNNLKFRNKEIYTLEYSSNAPFYPNYCFSGRTYAYEKEYGSYPLMLKKIKMSGSEAYEEETKRIDTVDHHDFYVENFQNISVFSDGVLTFGGKNNFLQDYSIINQLTDFKNYNGDFVYRRVRAVRSKYKKEGIENLDDISLATITNL